MREQVMSLTQKMRRLIQDYLEGTLFDADGRSMEQEKRKRARMELRRALRGCQEGNAACRRFVQDTIRDFLTSECDVNEQSMESYIPFHRESQLSDQDRFDILLYSYQKRYRNEAFLYLARVHGWDLLREKEGLVGYRVDAEDLRAAYRKERPSLTYGEELELLARRVYSLYRGCGIVDELLEQEVDGVNIGVSGSILQAKEGMRPWDSVWVILEGNSICLSFLGFGSEEEMIRVCRAIVSQGSAGALSRSRGYLVTERADGSRIAAARPPFGETWTVFLRKFAVSKYPTVLSLLHGQGADLAESCLRYLVKGEQVTALTGQQGTGKTTLLGALVGYIPAYYNIRVQELSFELHLRERYPNRNIASFRETEEIDGQEGLDFQKKTDGMVNILGEVASARVSNWMISIAQTASLFTLFTHHAVNTRSLLESLRNNLLMEGGFSSEKIALKQVVSVLRFDVHLARDAAGNRFIERITEIIEEENGYTLRTLLIRTGDGSYVCVNPFSEKMRHKIRSHLTGREREEFDHSIWGKEEVQGEGCYLVADRTADSGYRVGNSASWHQ